MAERVTQFYREYDGANPPTERVTQLYREYDGQQAPPAIRVSQLYREYDGTPARRRRAQSARSAFAP